MRSLLEVQHMQKHIQYVIGLLLACSVSASAAQPPSVREQLASVVDISRSLAAKAVTCDADILKEAVLSPVYVSCERKDYREQPEGSVFPTKEQLKEYCAARPWASAYGPLRDCAPGHSNLINVKYAPELRELLSDSDPAIRTLAVELLAILGQPEDAPRIAALLDQTAAGAPFLGWNMPNNMVFHQTGPYWGEADSPVIQRSWRVMTAGSYARRSIYYMTGVCLDAKTFPEWWRTHKNAKQCLWYWQQRAIHEINEIEASPYPIEGDQIASFETEQDSKKRAVMQELFSDLSHESPEVEAKVKLLIANRPISPDAVSELTLGSPLKLRVKPERLMELLERKNLWPDVDWNDGYNYNEMTKRIALHTTQLSTKCVPRLRAVHEKNREYIHWNGNSALTIAISRLLPPAKPSDLDNLDTRDGTLRSAIRTNDDTFAKGSLAQELVAIGLSPNWSFLKEQIFAETNPMNGIPDMRTSIVRALGEPPLTLEKRTALLDLLLDTTFKPYWVQSNFTMGYSSLLEAIIKAVNAHAGYKVITDNDRQMLSNPEPTEASLADIIKKIKSLDSSITLPAQ